MYSNALQEQKSQYNKTEMQIAHVVSRPEFHYLSNGALVFALNVILCTEKWNKHFTETVLAAKLHFKHTGLNLQENKAQHSKERKILV
jgi:hypothetical protein